MNPRDILLGLGLEEKETRIYLAALTLAEASVLEISRKSGVKRPTAYLVLRTLEEKGFISRVIRGKKTFFSPQHPRKLVTEAELRLKEVEEVVPQLESLFHKGAGKPRVLIYEGKEELDRAYDEWFVVKGELAYMGTLKLSVEAFPRTYQKLQYVILSPEFRIRELIDESEEARAYVKNVRGPHREVRLIPQEFLPFEVDIGIFGNRTLITSVRKEYFTIGIEGDEMARAFRTIFEVMWRTAKE